MDEALKYMIGQGTLGVLCCVLLFALRTVFKLYVESMEKRHADGIENRAALERSTSAMTALTDVIKSQRG